MDKNKKRWTVEQTDEGVEITLNMDDMTQVQQMDVLNHMHDLGMFDTKKKNNNTPD